MLVAQSRCQASSRHHSTKTTAKNQYSGHGNQTSSFAILVGVLNTILALGQRTTSTEHLAWETTDCDTDPNRNRSQARYPCDPTTIKSAPHCLASSTMTARGEPGTETDSTVIVGASLAFRVRLARSTMDLD